MIASDTVCPIFLDQSAAAIVTYSLGSPHLAPCVPRVTRHSSQTRHNLVTTPSQPRHNPGQNWIGEALRYFLADAVAVGSDAIMDALTLPALGLNLTNVDAACIVSSLISDGPTIDVATFAAGVDKQVQGLHQARSSSVQDWSYVNAGTAGTVTGMVWVNKRSLVASRTVPSDVLGVLGRAAGSDEPRGKVAPAIHVAKEEARLHELTLRYGIFNMIFGTMSHVCLSSMPPHTRRATYSPVLVGC